MEKISLETIYKELGAGLNPSQIAKKYGLHSSTVSKRLESQIKKTNNNNKNSNAKFKSSNIRLCYNCGNTNHILNAKFCGMCGKPLKTENELLADRLKKLISDAMAYIPETIRDEFRDTLLKAAEQIKKSAL